MTHEPDFDQWCGRCARADEEPTGCTIPLDAMLHDPVQWVRRADGTIACTEFAPDEPEPVRDERTADMF